MNTAITVGCLVLLIAGLSHSALESIQDLLKRQGSSHRYVTLEDLAVPLFSHGAKWACIGLAFGIAIGRTLP